VIESIINKKTIRAAPAEISFIGQTIVNNVELIPVNACNVDLGIQEDVLTNVTHGVPSDVYEK